MPTRIVYALHDSLTNTYKDDIDEASLRVQLKNCGLIVDSLKLGPISDIIEEIESKYNNEIDTVAVTHTQIEYKTCVPVSLKANSITVERNSNAQALPEVFPSYSHTFGHLLIN